MELEKINILEIDKGEAARYLGYKDTLPDINTTKIILECEAELLKIIEPRYCYKIFDIESILEDVVTLKGCDLQLKGKSISNHLKECSRAVVMCSTLSQEVDKLLRKNELNNMVNAIIIDALANACIEQVCDKAEEYIFKNLKEYSRTWRYGVGYGDFPLSTQQPLLETIDAQKRIGVCATASSILTPRKSVTCIIGISKEKIKIAKSTCDNCRMYEECNYRQNGTTCYKK